MREMRERERVRELVHQKLPSYTTHLIVIFFFFKLWEGEIETFRVVYTCFGLIYVNIRPLG